MAFDYKKEYQEFYLPSKAPGIVTVPTMNFLAVHGQGDPNEETGTYKQAMEMLYAVAFTIKMSKMGKHQLEGYFDYVVPPLEGLWWQEGTQGINYAHKKEFQRSFNGSPSSACLSLCQKKSLTGLSERLRKRNSKTSPQWSSFPGRKGCAYSVCISAPTTMSLPP